jgi:hypothetical protein
MENKMPNKTPRLTQQQKHILEKYSLHEWTDFEPVDKTAIAALCDKDLLEFQPLPGHAGQVRRKTIEGRNNYCATFRLSVPSNDKIAEFTTTVSYQGFDDLKLVEGMLIQQFATDYRCHRSAVKIETQYMENNSPAEHSYRFEDFRTELKPRLSFYQYEIQMTHRQEMALHERRTAGNWGELERMILEGTGVRSVNINNSIINITLKKHDPEQLKAAVFLINQHLNECIRDFPVLV